MQLRPIDIADAIQQALNAANIRSGAAPLPRDIPDPFCFVVPTGGTSQGVIDSHSVSVDVYASTDASATNAALDAIKEIRGMESKSYLDSFVYGVETGIPYNNPDPDHPTMPRVTFLLTIRTRGL